MTVLHRWEYDYSLRLTKCVPLPFGGVESHQSCIGCGAIVTDKQLADRNLPRDNVWIDMMTDNKPIEAGTLEEWWFRSKGTVPTWRSYLAKKRHSGETDGI